MLKFYFNHFKFAYLHLVNIYYYVIIALNFKIFSTIIFLLNCNFTAMDLMNVPLFFCYSIFLYVLACYHHTTFCLAHPNYSND